MAEALVSVLQVADRLSFVMTADEERECQGAIDDLSDDARHYGKAIWTNSDNTPPQVKNLILRAAARYMKNYEGYTQSRAGDESVSMVDRGPEAGSAHFTEREIKVLRELNGNAKSGLHTAGMVAYGNGPRRSVGFVRDSQSNEPIHYFASEEPW